MSGILYFVPEVPAVPAEMLAELGLAEVLGKSVTQAPINNGPDGKSGVIFKASTDDQPMGYKADTQRWVPGPKKQFWLGYDRENPPGPADLARETGLPGKWIELGDGNQWLVPVARLAITESVLPVRYELDDEGNDTFTVCREYQGLWDMAAELCSDFFCAVVAGKNEITMDTDRMPEIAAAAIGENYRVGLTECKLLGLLTSKNMTGIFNILVDFEGFLELTAQEAAKKKSTPDATAHTDSGQTDD